MCFVLYIGTDEPVRTIAWDERDRKVHTRELAEHDAGVARHFAKAHVTYVGSDQGCGCGFRHVMFQNGEWPEESMPGDDRDAAEETRRNHEQLHQFLKAELERSGEVELYGCWDGDFAEPSAGCGTLQVDRILDPGFHFRERFGYAIRRG